MKKVIWVESQEKLKELARLYSAQVCEINEVISFPCEVELVGNDYDKFIII
ncbi:hypothetical protein [Brevibacillus laterosporus]|uniref:hypothetical protein n=1 Tax=Brevibacillus laterosporus TaxID=1465 RepID=UPI0018F86CD7|nr:hypothetical protein [Brevibacillus laterosporus]